MRTLSSLSILAVLSFGCASAPPSPLRSPVDTVLDGWHQAASDADLGRYMGYFAPNAVFMGTDATERWTSAEFREYAREHFAAGQGWTYHSRDRHIAFSPSGTVAWVDERLDNDSYGELRGTGVLVNIDGQWKIAHYSMTFPIPNQIAPEVVKLIKQAVGPN